MTDTARSALLAELLAGEDPAADEYGDAVARIEGLVDAAIAEGIRHARADAFVVMWDGMPLLVAEDLGTAQAEAIAVDVKYLAPDRERQHRWDQEGNDTLVLRVKSLSTGRWVKTTYAVVTVPRKGGETAPACRCGAVPVHQHGCPSN